MEVEVTRLPTEVFNILWRAAASVLELMGGYQSRPYDCITNRGGGDYTSVDPLCNVLDEVNKTGNRAITRSYRFVLYDDGWRLMAR